MAGEMEILFSLAGRMHVLLRRELNRIIDVEWLCADAAYTREILKLARSAESEEIHKLADRIQEVHPLLLKVETRIPDLGVQTESKYVARLR